MNRPGDVFGVLRRLARQLQQAQREAQRQANQGARSNLRYAGGSGGGRGSGSGGPSPGVAAGGAGLLLVLVGGALVVNSAIYNVDGGHRAIKYSRLFGVMPDVYSEGTHMRVSPQLAHTCSSANDRFPGSRRRSSTTSALSRARSARSPARRTCRWLTLLCACCRGRTSTSCPPCTSCPLHILPVPSYHS